MIARLHDLCEAVALPVLARLFTLPARVRAVVGELDRREGVNQA